MFSDCIVPPDSKETELGSSDQEASPSAGKNTRIALVPCCAWKCVPIAISGGVDISKVPGSHSSPWFSAACAAAIDHRNHFFHLYQQNKSSESKVKFRQASNCCKRVLEAAQLACATKTKESITSQKLDSQDFC